VKLRVLRGERGTATLEFALVIPLVLLVVLAAMDFARALLAYTTVTNASREGVRYAVLNPTADHDQIEERVERRSVPLDRRALAVTVSYSYDNGATFLTWSDGIRERRPPERILVRVTVHYPWHAASAVAGAFFSATLQSQGFVSTSFMELRR
jgi:Flp pilus assembly protein TadG